VIRYRFLFQAEDGIRDGHVTGVQTCALPISFSTPSTGATNASRLPSGLSRTRAFSGLPKKALRGTSGTSLGPADCARVVSIISEIGRASWRERVQIFEVAAAVKRLTSGYIDK